MRFWLPGQRLLKFVASSEKSKFMICSDSLSCLFAIESCKTQNTFILKNVEIYKSLVAIGKHVIFTWIPSYIGIHGNTVVDREAKNALNDPLSNCSISIYCRVFRCYRSNFSKMLLN
jgi:hypothetical protein